MHHTDTESQGRFERHRENLPKKHCFSKFGPSSLAENLPNEQQIQISEHLPTKGLGSIDIDFFLSFIGLKKFGKKLTILANPNFPKLAVLANNLTNMCRLFETYFHPAPARKQYTQNQLQVTYPHLV